MKKNLMFSLVILFTFCASISIYAQRVERYLHTSDGVQDLQAPQQFELKTNKNPEHRYDGFVTRNNLMPSINNDNSLTPVETFEGAFPPTGWDTTIIQGSTTQYWIKLTSTTVNLGAYGLSPSCAKYNFFNSAILDYQILSSPTFPASLANEFLFFDYAYAPYAAGNANGPLAADTMIVQVTTNGGTTWTDLLMMTADSNFSAQNIAAANFMGTVPKSTSSTAVQIDNGWSTKKLALPVGTNGVRFFAKSQFGNSFLLDNVMTMVPRAPLAGAYTVSAGAPTATNYNTLAQLQDSLNQRGISGPVTVSVTNATYTERFYLGAIAGTSATNTININFNGATLIPLGNASTVDYVVLLSGTKWTTIRNLNVRNGGAYNPTSIQRGVVISASGVIGAKNNTLFNVNSNLSGAGNTPQRVFSTGVVITTSTPGFPGGTLDSNTVDSCQFNASDRGIGVFNTLQQTSNAVLPAYKNIVVKRCTLGSTARLGTDTTGNGPIGIILSGVSNGKVFNNTIDSIAVMNTTLTTASVIGLSIQLSSGDYYNNKIRYVYNGNATLTTVLCTGIQSGPLPGEETVIYNNQIARVLRGYTGAATVTRLVFGLRVTFFIAGQPATSITRSYNNSIYLTTKDSATYSSSALEINSGGVQSDVYNNLAVNNLRASGTALNYAVVDLNTTNAFMMANYNAYYASGPRGYLGLRGTVIDTNLFQWKNNKQMDTNSVFVNLTMGDSAYNAPVTNDSSWWALNGRGIAVAKVTTDINGAARNTLVTQGPTDIGAYEFNMTVQPPVAIETTGLTPAGGVTNVWTAFGDTVCAITWTGTGPFPTLAVRRFSGALLPGAPGALKSLRSFDSVSVASGSLGATSTYALMHKYSYNSIYNVTNSDMSRLVLLRKFSGSFYYYPSTVKNVPRRSITASNLNSFSLFAGADSSTITNTGNENTELPTQYSLSQNYPNPFNPATTIKFAVPYEGLVHLRVYDMLGREVASLVSENLAPGYYDVNFNASILSSGIYFYKMEVMDGSSVRFASVKKMSLIK